jgi:hypothetical protein
LYTTKRNKEKRVMNKYAYDLGFQTALKEMGMEKKAMDPDLVRMLGRAREGMARAGSNPLSRALGTVGSTVSSAAGSAGRAIGGVASRAGRAVGDVASRAGGAVSDVASQVGGAAAQVPGEAAALMGRFESLPAWQQALLASGGGAALGAGVGAVSGDSAGEGALRGALTGGAVGGGMAGGRLLAEKLQALKRLGLSQRLRSLSPAGRAGLEDLGGAAVGGLAGLGLGAGVNAAID